MDKPLPWLAVASTSHGDALFYVLVALHAASALTGFASIGFAGTYASRAGRLLGAGSEARLGAGGRLGGEGPGPSGEVVGPTDRSEVEELQRYFARPATLWWALLAVPVLGAAALSAQPGGHGFDQGWVLGALLAWLVAGVIAGRLVVPALGQLGALLAEAFPARGGAGDSGGHLPEGIAVRAARAGLVASRGAAACDCLFFVALALMIWQPA